MSVRAMRQAMVIVGVTVVLLIGVAYALYRYIVGFPGRPAQRPGRQVTLTIPRGADFDQIVDDLTTERLVSNGLAFRLYASYRGLVSRVRAGTYQLSTSTTPRELLDTLVAGVPAPTVNVLIPEGKQMLEVARILADASIAPYQQLVASMRDARFLHRIGVPATTIEGFLFPDTYRLRAHTPVEDVLSTLVRRHQRVFVELRSTYRKRTHWLRRHLGWSHLEIVTLASIVEKETGQPAERPVIAGVFLNRLEFASFQPKVLQTDPTIVYGCTVPVQRSPACQQFKGRIRRIQLQDSQNPYNTYVHPGLPPGPISNPGRAAIEAVFRPKRTRYLYFVSRNDGTHEFSTTRAEHERAVDQYQRRRPASGDAGGT